MMIKKFLILVLLITLPLLIVGCKNENNEPASLYLTPITTSVEVEVSRTVQLEYDTNITNLTWESFDEEVCTIDENGVITGHKKGEATVICYYYGVEGNFEFEVTVNVVPKLYRLTIYGYDEVRTYSKGAALLYILQQEYGAKKHPDFGNNIFQGYYEDKELTKELDLYTHMDDDMTIYPKLKEDETKCEYVFAFNKALFYGDELVLNDKIQVLTPDYAANTKNENVNYSDYFLVTATYDYNSKAHFVTNTHLDGDKQNVTIPYNGFVIIIPKTHEKFEKLSDTLKIGTKISLDRYSINVANRIYINEEKVKKDVEKFNVNVTATFSTAYDYTNDTFLFEKNADSKAYPASTTKIITALAAVKYAPLDLKITVGDELDVMYEGSSPGTAGSKKGQVWTLRQLLYAMLLPSGNDSAYTIAAGVARSIPGNENKSTRELLDYFNNLMNEVRYEVGATNSNFMVPDGNSYYTSTGAWSDRITYHYVTANDMVKFAIYAFNCPGIAKVVSTPNINFKLENGEQYVFNNTNGLIKPSSDYYYPYAVGMKTGTTNPAGQCLIFGAEVEGRFVIGAAMKSTNRHADALTILKAAFKN